ncbi:MAG: hypothetical protein GXO54_03050, partial [Chloroflexi bacterium]|nr:hypothetical protein [Chloroflexota bacterium]
VATPPEVLPRVPLPEQGALIVASLTPLEPGGRGSRYAFEWPDADPARLERYIQQLQAQGWQEFTPPWEQGDGEASLASARHSLSLCHAARQGILQVRWWAGTNRALLLLTLTESPQIQTCPPQPGRPRREALVSLPTLRVPPAAFPLPPYAELRAWLEPGTGANQLLYFRTTDIHTVRAALEDQLHAQGWRVRSHAQGALWGRPAWLMYAVPEDPTTSDAAGLYLLIGQEPRHAYFAWLWAWPPPDETVLPAARRTAHGAAYGPEDDPARWRYALQVLLASEASDSALWVQTAPEALRDLLPPWDAPLQWVYSLRSRARPDGRPIWRAALRGARSSDALLTALDQAFRRAGWVPGEAQPSTWGDVVSLMTTDAALPSRVYCGPQGGPEVVLQARDVDAVQSVVMLTLSLEPSEMCRSLAASPPPYMPPEPPAPRIRLRLGEDLAPLHLFGQYSSRRAIASGLWVSSTPLTEQFDRLRAQMAAQGWAIQDEGTLGEAWRWLIATKPKDGQQWRVRVLLVRLGPEDPRTWGVFRFDQRPDEP